MRANELHELTERWAGMSLDDQVVNTVLSLSRQMGEIAATIEYMERSDESQAKELHRLKEEYQKLNRDREIEKLKRRHLPDELLEFVRKEHERSVAKEKFYKDLRDGLLKKGLLGIAGVLGLALLAWGKEVWPHAKAWLIEHLSR